MGVLPVFSGGGGASDGFFVCIRGGTSNGFLSVLGVVNITVFCLF